MATNGEKEQRIRERAYQIWLDEGQPEGHDKEHWQQAEIQVSTEAVDQPANGAQPPLAGPYENIS
jgi:hypothetical protein